MKNIKIKSIDGLFISLDKLICEYDKSALSKNPSYSYIYFLTAHNFSDRTITLLGTKWILRSKSNVMTIIEEEKIVSQIPTLFPGESFSYNNYHLILEPTIAVGSLYGIDEYDQAIHIRIPRFGMKLPIRKKFKNQNEIHRSQ